MHLALVFMERQLSGVGQARIRKNQVFTPPESARNLGVFDYYKVVI
jgi:hypothetical protein